MITLSYFFFAIILVIYAVVSGFITYHLVRFGVGVETKIMAIVFSVGVVVLVVLLFDIINSISLSELANQLKDSF